MLNITKNKENDIVTIALDGRLDTTTAPQLEEELKALDDVKTLILDLENLVYVSSAGLRVFLSTQKRMNNVGELKLINVVGDVMDIFEVTGFSDILNIE